MGAIASQITSLTQPFIQAQIKENIKATRNWPLCGEFTGDFPAQKASNVIMIISGQNGSDKSSSIFMSENINFGTWNVLNTNLRGLNYLNPALVYIMAPGKISDTIWFKPRKKITLFRTYKWPSLNVCVKSMRVWYHFSS